MEYLETTPDDLATWIVKRFGNTKAGPPKAILDPGCGTGAPFAHAARAQFPDAEIVGVDTAHVVAGEFGTVVHHDFLDEDECLNDASFDLVIGCPPVDKAAEFIDRALSTLINADGRLVFLLPLEFLSGQHRFWATHIPAILTVLSESPGVSRSYAVFVWDYGVTACSGQGLLYVESWKGQGG